MKNRFKVFSIVLTLVLLCGTVTKSYTSAASSIYFAGEYRNSTKKIKYKLYLNEYSSPEGKIVGNYEFKAITKGYAGWNGELKKIGKNKYQEKTPASVLDGYTLTFTVSKNKVVVKQKGQVLRGVNFSGTYKLKKRFPRP